MKTFINYTLGITEEPNVKTVIGTMAHKVLEILALCKLNEQNGWPENINDEAFGEITKDFPYNSNSGVDKIIDKVFKYYSEKSAKQFDEKKDKKTVTKHVYTVLEHANGIYDPRKGKIFAAEKHFDMKLTSPWAEYSYELNGQKTSTNLCIKGTVDLIMDVGNDTIEVIDYKGLPTNTPIPTINGWKNMGDLEVGDIVFDKDGNETMITAKSKKSYKPCYTIIFDDGVQVTCDHEHLWMLSDGSVTPITELKAGDKIDKTKLLVSDIYDEYEYDVGGCRTIKYIIKLHDERETQCISVDSPTNTYLCTKNFIPTHNTGQRKDWSKATPTVKEYEDLCKDTQLMFYYYALKKLYPNKNVLFTIFFTQDGGPFTLCFGDEHIEYMEKFLEEKANEIWKATPAMLSTGQTHFKCTKMCDYYKNKWEGSDKNICRYVSDHMKEYGVQITTENLKDKNFTLGTYQNPGT